MQHNGDYSFAIEAVDLHRRYGPLEVLKGVSLVVPTGKMISIVGKSGSGKSTLLHILGTLDVPDSGSILIGGMSIAGMTARKLAALRNEKLGFVFQFHHLLPEFTAQENIAMPSLIRGQSRKTAMLHAAKWLDYLGLSDRAHHKPNQLSGGEQQRVAIGRALMNEPDILLADEPSGNLDNETSQQVHRLLRNITTDLGKSLVIVTHNMELARLSDEMYEMADGSLSEIVR